MVVYGRFRAAVIGPAFHAGLGKTPLTKLSGPFHGPPAPSWMSVDYWRLVFLAVPFSAVMNLCPSTHGRSRRVRPFGVRRFIAAFSPDDGIAD
jgi:hypothetical protein